MAGVSSILEAPAKLTLSLRIAGVRPDGYHLIDAEMVTVSLHDTLRIEERPPGEVVLDVRLESTTSGAGAGAAGPESIPAGSDNLVAQALELVARGARVGLDKRIPPGAGLGGGSADAAAILRWAGFSDLSVAASIGADVAFCVVGGRARVSGIGEVIEPLEYRPRTFTLLTPPLFCSTPAVYAAWDDLGGPIGANGNDLEPAALVVEPDLAIYRDQLGDHTGLVPRLAGSGSTWFVEGSFPGEGLVVVETIEGF